MQINLSPIKKIWQASLETGKLPKSTVQAIIPPVYKGEVKSNSANYRPVILTNHLKKILQRIVKKSMGEYLEFNEVMNPAQHGFRHKRSTVDEILSFL